MPWHRGSHADGTNHIRSELEKEHSRLQFTVPRCENRVSVFSPVSLTAITQRLRPANANGIFGAQCCTRGESLYTDYHYHAAVFALLYAFQLFLLQNTIFMVVESGFNLLSMKLWIVLP